MEGDGHNGRPGISASGPGPGSDRGSVPRSVPGPVMVSDEDREVAGRLLRAGGGCGHADAADEFREELACALAPLRAPMRAARASRGSSGRRYAHAAVGRLSVASDLDAMGDRIHEIDRELEMVREREFCLQDERRALVRARASLVDAASAAGGAA